MDGQELPFFYNFIAMGFVVICGIGTIALLRRAKRDWKTRRKSITNQQKDKEYLHKCPSTTCPYCGGLYCTCGRTPWFKG